MSLAKRLFTTAYFAMRGRIETRVPYWSERAIRERQTTRLRKIVTHAFRHVPYYRAIERSQNLSERDIQTVDDLSRLPLIDGRTLQQNPQHFVSDAFDPASLRKVHSTGTAAYGSKIIYWPPREFMSKIVYAERGRQVVRRLLGKAHGIVRLSFFHPDSSTAKSTRFHTARLIIPRALMKTYWSSTELPFSEIADRFNELRPDIAYSYGSFAESFLLAVLDQDLDVRLPKVWSFGGDGITSEGRRRIEQNLPCRLHSSYRAVEGGRIGFECELGSGYHINTDICHVRLVDEQGETVKPGAVGGVVISNFVNPGTVLLNYRLGDYAAWKVEPCACGRRLPLLLLVGSRVSSFLQLRNGRRLQEHVLLHACKERIQEVLQFQILEHAPESITWRVVLAKTANRDEIAAALVDCSRSIMSPDADIQVEFVDRIAHSPRAKLTRIVHAGIETIRDPRPQPSSPKPDF